jgi:hypothetical protein
MLGLIICQVEGDSVKWREILSSGGRFCQVEGDSVKDNDDDDDDWKCPGIQV